MKKSREEKYTKHRLRKARIMSIPFYLCRMFPIQKNKIVFCCIEGTTGYSCNPKYIAEELLRKKGDERYDMVWLVNDRSKQFPTEIKKAKNSLWKRAYHLSTAKIWIDNSRKQLEVRKRKGQVYIQTWHAKLGFKPTCLDRGASFSKIAYLVSKHDSDMIDYVLSNSKWYDDTLPTGMLYNGAILRTGSPRCDILVRDKKEIRKQIRLHYGLPLDAKILMYAPTFRGGSQGTNRTIETNQGFPDFEQLHKALQRRFDREWYIFQRFHPQLVARELTKNECEGHIQKSFLVDVSRDDDMYEILAGCDVFMTDYSSAAFDAAVMRIPVFLYADDYTEYEKERGKLLWNLRELPFSLATDNQELRTVIESFDEEEYQKKLSGLFEETQMVEDGSAASHVVAKIKEIINDSQ